MTMPVNLNYAAAEALAMQTLQRKAIPGPWKEGYAAGSVVSSVEPEPDERTNGFYGGRVVCETVLPAQANLIIFAQRTDLPRVALELVDRVKELEKSLEWHRSVRRMPLNEIPRDIMPDELRIRSLEQRMDHFAVHHPDANYFDNQIEKIRQAVSALSDKLCAAEKSQFSSQMRIGKNTESLLELRGRVVDLADRLEDHAHVLPNSDIVDHGVIKAVLERVDVLEKALLSNEKRIGALYRMREEECACEEPRHDILPPLAIDAAKLSPGTRAQAEPFLDNSAVVPTSRDIRGECREWLVTVQKQMSDGGVPDPGTVADVATWLATVPDPSEVPMVLRKLRRLMEKEEKNGKSDQ